MRLETLVKLVITLNFFKNVNNGYSSFSSANVLHDPSGHQVYESIDLIRLHPGVNSLASPINLGHTTGWCTCEAEPNDTYVLPLYGEVANCTSSFHQYKLV